MATLFIHELVATAHRHVNQYDVVYYIAISQSELLNRDWSECYVMCKN